MQWFTRAWVNAELSDEEIDRRKVSYQEHYRRILPTLGEQVAALAATDLHDGLVFAWSLDLDRGEIMLRILAGDLQRGYQFVDLAFRAATLVGLSPAELEALLPDCEILYEEIDRTDTGYEYRLILDPEGEFAIRFEDVSVSTEPAAPKDRNAWFTMRKGQAEPGWFSVRCIFRCGDGGRDKVRRTPRILTDDPATAAASVRRLAQLEFEVAVFGHGRAVTGRAVDRFRELAAR